MKGDLFMGSSGSSYELAEIVDKEGDVRTHVGEVNETSYEPSVGGSIFMIKKLANFVAKSA